MMTLQEAKAAARNGDVQAIKSLINYYMNTNGCVGKKQGLPPISDMQEAYKWAEFGASLDDPGCIGHAAMIGDIIAQSSLEIGFWKDAINEFTEALNWGELAEEHGAPLPQNWQNKVLGGLAKCFAAEALSLKEAGDPNSQKSWRKACKAYKMQTVRSTMDAYGYEICLGEIEPQTSKIELRRFKMLQQVLSDSSTEKDKAGIAYCKLGELYRDSDVIPTDHMMARACFQKAAEMGCTLGCDLLNAYYAKERSYTLNNRENPIIEERRCCEICGSDLVVGALYCDQCGCNLQTLLPEISNDHCCACHAQLVKHAQFCDQCGESVSKHQAVHNSDFVGTDEHIPNSKHIPSENTDGIEPTNTPYDSPTQEGHKVLSPFFVIIFILLLATLIVLASIFWKDISQFGKKASSASSTHSSVTEAFTYNGDADWQAAYRTFLEEMISRNLDDSDSAHGVQLAFVDINSDGIPELLSREYLDNTAGDSYLHVYYFSSKGIAQLEMANIESTQGGTEFAQYRKLSSGEVVYVSQGSFGTLAYFGENITLWGGSASGELYCNKALEMRGSIDEDTLKNYLTGDYIYSLDDDKYCAYSVNGAYTDKGSYQRAQKELWDDLSRQNRAVDWYTEGYDLFLEPNGTIYHTNRAQGLSDLQAADYLIDYLFDVYYGNATVQKDNVSQTTPDTSTQPVQENHSQDGEDENMLFDDGTSQSVKQMVVDVIVSGSYRIQSAYDNRYLCVGGEKHNDDTGKSGQYISMGQFEEAAILTISAEQGPNCRLYLNGYDGAQMVLDAWSSQRSGSGVEFWTYGKDADQQWVIEIQSDGTCIIYLASNSELVLTNDLSINNQDMVNTTWRQNESRQRWILHNTNIDSETTTFEAMIRAGKTIYYDRGELLYFSQDYLRLLRNGLYAIDGLRFDAIDLQRFFEKYDWYSPYTNDAEAVYRQFNSIQLENLDTILTIEKEKGYRN